MNKFIFYSFIIICTSLSMPAIAEDEGGENVEQTEPVVSEPSEPEQYQGLPDPATSEAQVNPIQEEGGVGQPQPTVQEVPSEPMPEEKTTLPLEEAQAEGTQLPAVESDEVSLAQATEGLEQAANEVEAAGQVEEKAQQGVEDLLSKMGDNPTPAQREELKKTVTSFVAAAETTEKAEQKVSQARERALSVRIQDNISSNAPAEPGF